MEPKTPCAPKLTICATPLCPPPAASTSAVPPRQSAVGPSTDISSSFTTASAPAPAALTSAKPEPVFARGGSVGHVS